MVFSYLFPARGRKRKNFHESWDGGRDVFSYLFPARGRKLDVTGFNKFPLGVFFLSFPRKGTETDKPY